MEKTYEQLPSTSELKLKIFGQSCEALFENAVIAMFDCQDLELGKKTTLREVSVDGIDYEHLIVEFLSEALYLSYRFKEAYLVACIKEMSTTNLKAELTGTLILSNASDEIKAVTHHGVCVEERDGLWQTEIILDI